MHKNTNYFSDVINLLLEAKNNEQIKVDPQAKAEIQARIANKIAEIKAVGKKMPDPTPKQAGPWWKLIGVPATIGALMIMLYAALPKDGVPQITEPEPKTPQYALQTTDTDATDALQQDTEDRLTDAEEDADALQATQEPDEPERVQTPRPRPELLVLDVSEMGRRHLEPEARTLNKIPETGGSPDLTAQIQESDQQTARKETPAEPTESADQAEQETPAEPTEQDSKATEQESDKSTIIARTPEDQEAEDTPLKQEEPEADKRETRSAESAQQETEEPTTIVLLPREQEDDDSAKGTRAEAQEESQATFPVFTTLPNSIANRVKYYNAEQFAESADFDEKILYELTKNISPDEINIYYRSSSSVLVEIKKNGISKWYLYAKSRSGSWTIQKYEKHTSLSMLQ